MDLPKWLLSFHRNDKYGALEEQFTLKVDTEVVFRA